MSRRGTEAGMTLLEVLISMSILIVGMSGVLGLFATALALQKRAVERYDVGINLQGVLAEIERDLADRAGAGADRARIKGLSGEEFPVPGDPRYRYRVTVEEIPASARGFLCRVVLVATAGGRAREYDFGYLPVIPAQTNDARIRALLDR